MSDNQDKFYEKFYALFNQLSICKEDKNKFMNILSIVKQLLKLYINSSDSQTDVLVSKLVTLEQHLDDKVIQNLSIEKILDNIGYYLSYIKKIRDTSNKRLSVPIKSGVDFVFEQNPELASIGTKEQYSLYLETIFPESKIKDIVYHCSSNKFSEFNDPSGSGLSHIWFSEKPLNYQYGEHMYSVILNIKNPLNEFDNKNYNKEINNYETPINPEWVNNYHLTGELPQYKYDGTIRVSRVADGKSITARTPKQIHILGSKQDIEGFKGFVSRYRN